MTSIPRLTSRASAGDVVEHLETAGCVMVEKLAEAELLDTIDAELENLPEIARNTGNEFSGLFTKRLNGMLEKLPATQVLALHPLVLAVVDRMLSPYCARFQLNFDGIMQVCPGETLQTLHRDGFIYPFRHPTLPFTIACMWAQSEFTASNGSTRLAPGSHLWAHEREPEVHEVVTATMSRGSLLIYTGGIYHGAGANTANSPRTGLSLQYTVGWLRQEVNMYLTYPPEVAKTFPDDLQRLIGYEFGAPYLGFVDAGSPHVVLEENPSATSRERTYSDLDSAAAKVAPIPLGKASQRPA